MESGSKIFGFKVSFSKISVLNYFESLDCCSCLTACWNKDGAY
jgi:hypothetical protein